MELVPVTRDVVGNIRRNGKITKIIEQFMDMDECAVEVKYSHKNVQTAYNSIFQAAKRMDCGVMVARRGDKVYLVKEDVDELFI